METNRYIKVKCNLCHQGLCDADLDFHTGEYYVED